MAIQPNIVFILNYFKIVYLAALIVFIFLLIFIFLVSFKINEENFSKIFLIFLSTIFIFNIFDNSKSYEVLPFFEKEQKKTFTQKRC